MPKCTKCSLDRETYVPGAGPPSAKIFFVGEAPGADEVASKPRTPFVGAGGQLLNGIMYSIGLDRKEVFISNVVKCRPPNNRTPTAEEIDCCRDQLLKEIAAVKPIWIVALGETAARFFYPDLGLITEWRGYTFIWKEYKVIITFHPAYIMRKWKTKSDADLFKIVSYDIFKTRLISKFYAESYQLDPSVDVLEKYLSKSLPTSIDLETTGLNVWTDEITAIGFSNEPGTGISVSFTPEYAGTIRSFLKSKVPKIYQHKNFDVLFLRTKGYEVEETIWDTQIAAHWIWSDGPYNLDFIRSIYTTMKPYKKEATRSGWHVMSREDYALMNAKDADATIRSYEAQKEYVDEKTMQYLLQQEDLAMAMKVRGVRFDKRAAAVQYLKLGPKAQEILDRYLKDEKVLISSPAQILEHLKSKYKVHLKDTKDKTLEIFLERDALTKEVTEFIQAIRDYRGFNKASATYIEGVFPLVNEKTQRVHPEWNTCGTDGSRWSCSKPSMQNVPHYLRHVWIPEDGKVFIGGDYSSLEFLIGGVFSNEKDIIEAVLKGYDIHGEIGKEVVKFYPIVTRWQCKAVVFGTMYGRTARSISTQLRMPLNIAEKLQKFCLGRFPNLAKWLKRQGDFWKKYGYVESFHKRRKYCQKLTEALNSSIQSTAAEICINGLLALETHGFNTVLQVHDQLVVEEDSEDKAKEFKRLLETSTPTLHHTFPVKIKIGKNWEEVT